MVQMMAALYAKNLNVQPLKELSLPVVQVVWMTQNVVLQMMGAYHAISRLRCAARFLRYLNAETHAQPTLTVKVQKMAAQHVAHPKLV